MPLSSFSKTPSVGGCWEYLAALIAATRTIHEAGVAGKDRLRIALRVRLTVLRAERNKAENTNFSASLSKWKWIPSSVTWNWKATASLASAMPYKIKFSTIQTGYLEQNQNTVASIFSENLPPTHLLVYHERLQTLGTKFIDWTLYPGLLERIGMDCMTIELELTRKSFKSSINITGQNLTFQALKILAVERCIIFSWHSGKIRVTD